MLGCVHVARDITERKRAEQQLQKEHRTLKHLLQSSDHDRQTIAYESMTAARLTRRGDYAIQIRPPGKPG
jgi:hypothetical protein